MRLKQSLKNLKFSLIYYTASVLSSFLLRKIMLLTIGLAGVSLNSLFNEVIAMMSLTEMGVGTAIVYNLYEPLSLNDQEKIRQLMNLFRKVYSLIAVAMLIIGAIITPFIQLIVNSTGYSISYIRYIFNLFVVQTALSYLFAYKRSILAADQKNYVVARWDSIFKFLIVGLSALALWLTKRFDIYLYTTIILTFINNWAISNSADKIYPFLKNNNSRLPKKDINKVFDNVKNLFVSRLSGTVTNSTDNVLISVLVNTLQVGIYANYALIINAFKSILVQINNAIQGSVGNLFVETDNKHISTTLFRMTYGYFTFSTIFCSTYLACSKPFIVLVFGKEYLLNFQVVFITTINLFFHAIREPLWQMMAVSGLFKDDRNIALLGTIVNLIVSIIVGVKLGILGIFIGTSCTYIIQILLKIPILYNKALKLDCKKYFYYIILLIFEFVCISLINYRVISFISCKNVLTEFLIKGFLSVILSGILVFAVSNRTSEFKYYLSLIKSKTEKKDN